RALGERDALRIGAKAIETDVAAQRELIARVDELRAKKGPREELVRLLDELRAIPHEKRLLHADVDEDLVAAIVGDWTGIPVGRMVQDDVRAIVELEPKLR